MGQDASASTRVALRVHWLAFGLVVGAAVVWWLVFRTARVATFLGIEPKVILIEEYASMIAHLYALQLFGVLLGLSVLGAGLVAAVKVKSRWTAGWLAIAAYGATMLSLIGTLLDVKGEALPDVAGWGAILLYVGLSAYALRRATREGAA